MPLPFVFIGIGVITALVGAGTGTYGLSQMSEANSIVEKAKEKYERELRNLRDKESICETMLDSFGKLKMDIWSKDFQRFIEIYEKIKNKPNVNNNIKDDKLDISKDELGEIKKISIGALEFLGGIAGSATVGLFAGVGALGGATLFGVASTGTAISTLSGIAATNATLAFFGGGSLAAGGLGMAGGTMVLGGLVAGPALALGGIFLAFKGSDSIEKAKKIQNKSNEAVRKFKIVIDRLNKIINLTTKMIDETKKLREHFLIHLKHLESVVNLKYTDYNKFSFEEKKSLEITILYLKALKNILGVSLVKKEGEVIEYNPDAEKILIVEVEKIKNIKH